MEDRDQETLAIIRAIEKTSEAVKSLQVMINGRAEDDLSQPKPETSNQRTTRSPSPVHTPGADKKSEAWHGLSKEDIKALVHQEMVIAKNRGSEFSFKKTGRPYPSEYDEVMYPKGYSVPKFTIFSGDGLKGSHPEEHLAHFIVDCANTGSNDALLLRQFPQSLKGPAFEWYYSLENGSIKTWEDMSNAFRAKFAAISNKISLADLTSTKPRENESALDYIARWRNLSIKCDRELSQKESIDLITSNIGGWMTPYLSVADLGTYSKLISVVAKLEGSAHRPIPSTPQPKRNFTKKPEPRVPWTPKTVREGALNVEASTSEGTKDRPKGNRPASPGRSGNNDRPSKTLLEMKSKPYSFRKDKVRKLFKQALKDGLQLPDSKRLAEANRTDDPNYCP